MTKEDDEKEIYPEIAKSGLRQRFHKPLLGGSNPPLGNMIINKT